MDQYPAHWEKTLMGSAFWKSAGLSSEDTSDPLRLDNRTGTPDPFLPQRFPFNQSLGLELGPRVTDEKDKEAPNEPPMPKDTPKKGGLGRRLSIPDARGSIGLQRRGSSTPATSRFRDFRRRARSPSPSKTSAPVTPVGPRFWTLKSSAPVTPASSRYQLRSPLKRETTVKAVEISASPFSSPSPSPAPVPAAVSAIMDTGTPAKPIVGFRGGASWACLSRDKTTLGLDLFWPSVDQDEMYCLTIIEIRPLCQFRSLRSLKLVGMMQSYQTYIWQAAWLNPGLDELELGMALEPEITSGTHGAPWLLIQEGWVMEEKGAAGPVYYGHLGDGELHPNIGYGEYLDKHCIEKAKIRALAMGRTCKRLSIKSLTLSGFVVDADPFLHWFDPLKLRSVHFKGQCVDAGFWLPQAMDTVAVRCPRKIDLDVVPVGVLKLDLKKDSEVVELKGGKKVGGGVLGDSDMGYL